MAEEKAKEYQLVIFSIGDEEFGVELEQVKEIVRLVPITYVPKTPEFIEGVVNLRGQILAVIDLAKKIGIVSRLRNEAARIIVVEIENDKIGVTTVGMIVDSVSEVLRLSAEDVEGVPSIVDTDVPDHYIRGVGKLKKRLIILLNLNSVLSHEEVRHVEQHVNTVSDKEKS